MKQRSEKADLLISMFSLVTGYLSCSQECPSLRAFAAASYLRTFKMQLQLEYS
jgi:hypothetical protein